MYQPHHSREGDLNVQRAEPLEWGDHPEPAGSRRADVAKDLTEMAKRAKIQELMCCYGSPGTE